MNPKDNTSKKLKKYNLFLLYNLSHFIIQLFNKIQLYDLINYDILLSLLINFIFNIYLIGLFNKKSLNTIRAVIQDGCNIMFDYIKISHEEKFKSNSYHPTYSDAIHFAYQKILNKIITNKKKNENNKKKIKNKKNSNKKKSNYVSFTARTEVLSKDNNICTKNKLKKKWDTDSKLNKFKKYNNIKNIFKKYDNTVLFITNEIVNNIFCNFIKICFEEKSYINYSKFINNKCNYLKKNNFILVYLNLYNYIDGIDSIKNLNKNENHNQFDQFKKNKNNKLKFENVDYAITDEIKEEYDIYLKDDFYKIINLNFEFIIKFIDLLLIDIIQFIKKNNNNENNLNTFNILQSINYIFKKYLSIISINYNFNNLNSEINNSISMNDNILFSSVYLFVKNLNSNNFKNIENNYILYIDNIFNFFFNLESNIIPNEINEDLFKNLNKKFNLKFNR